MSMHINPINRAKQQGSTLLIVVVLLLLATLIVVFAVNLGMMTQRSSGNDLRSRLVQQTADSALSQAAETILADSEVLTDESAWEQCTATDTTFPCGSIPAGRRQTMFRFISGTAGLADKEGIFSATGTAMHDRMLDIDNKVGFVNNTTNAGTDGFEVKYGVGVVMCRLALAAAGVAPTCTTDFDVTPRVYAVTLVAVAAMPSEGARATAVKSFATNTKIAFGPGVPPITASGLVDLKGTLQVVTSPNGAGIGVPTSIWTRGSIDPGGTPDSCQADEFYRSGTPAWYPTGATEQILRCDTCTCSIAPLTGTQGNTCTGGSDLLFGGTSACGTNNPIDKTNPEDFPCDLFEYVFGISAWEDTTSPKDNYCETKIFVNDAFDGGVIGADEAFLAAKADWIVSGTTGFGSRFVGDTRLLADCSVATMAGKSGLVWDRLGACNSNTLTLGTPAAPVLLVYDGPAAPFHATLFGLLFARNTFADGKSPPVTVAETDPGADLQINSNLAIYGSVVIQGQVKANGTAAIVHNGDVLTNLINNLNTPDVISLPGSWSDNVRY